MGLPDLVLTSMVSLVMSAPRKGNASASRRITDRILNIIRRPLSDTQRPGRRIAGGERFLGVFSDDIERRLILRGPIFRALSRIQPAKYEPEQCSSAQYQGDLLKSRYF